MELKRILIVDDSPQRREVLLRLLQEQHYEVLQAATCEEALEVLSRESVGLVLTETELPTKSGLFLLKTVKDGHPEIEVILITHNASSYNLLQALRLGAYDFIVRPIDTGEILYNAVERAFGNVLLREQNSRLIKELEENNRSLRRTLKMMKALNESIERLTVTREIEDLLRELLDSAMKEIQARRGFLALLDKGTGELGLKAGEGIPAEHCRLYASHIPKGITSEIARRAKPLLIPEAIPAKLAALSSVAEREDLFAPGGLVAAPLLFKGRSIGVVVLTGQHDGNSFSEHDLHFLIQLSHHAALALEKAGIIHQLKRGRPPSSMS